MRNMTVKKVVVELENGSKLEFDKQVIVFAEDEMSGTEKAMFGSERTKVCGIVSCNSAFTASVVESLLGSLKDEFFEVANESDVMKMLEDIFG